MLEQKSIKDNTRKKWNKRNSTGMGVGEKEKKSEIMKAWYYHLHIF